MFVLQISSDLNRNSKSAAFYKQVDIWETDEPLYAKDGPVYNNVSQDTWTFKTIRECLEKIAEYVEVNNFVVVKQKALYDFEAESLDGYSLMFDPKIKNHGENDRIEWDVVFRRQNGNDIFYN